jgi:hypothetical protein
MQKLPFARNVHIQTSGHLRATDCYRQNLFSRVKTSRGSVPSGLESPAFLTSAHLFYGRARRCAGPRGHVAPVVSRRLLVNDSSVIAMLDAADLGALASVVEASGPTGRVRVRGGVRAFHPVIPSERVNYRQTDSTFTAPRAFAWDHPRLLTAWSSLAPVSDPGGPPQRNR